MDLKKAWILVKKDTAEYKKQKYILYSIILMPLVFSIFIPVSMLLPVMMEYQDECPCSPFADGGLPQTNRTLVGAEVRNAALNSTAFMGGNLSNVVITGSTLHHVNLTNAVVSGSYLKNCTLVNVILDASESVNTTGKEVITVNGTLYEAINEETGPFGMSFEGFVLYMLDSILLIFILIPAIIPTIIASYSFVGEKVNRSLEPLLATPLSEAELLAGKSLAIFIPSMAATLMGFVVLSAVVYIMTMGNLAYMALTRPEWLLGIFVLAPLFCMLSIQFNVIVSSRVSDVRVSQQVGALVVLPAVLLFFVVLTGVAQLDLVFLLFIAAMLALLNGLVLYIAVKVFNREEILVKWK